MNVDRNDLMTVESSMNELGRELDVRNNIIREKERKLMEIEKAINETEKSYDIVHLHVTLDRRHHAQAVKCPRIIVIASADHGSALNSHRSTTLHLL